MMEYRPSSLVRVGGSQAIMINLSVKKRDNALRSTWFQEQHFREVLALLHSNILQYVHECTSNEPKKNTDKKKWSGVLRAGELTGMSLRVKYHFAKRHIHNTCLIPENMIDLKTCQKQNDIKYKNYHILPHKVVVRVYQHRNDGSQGTCSVASLQGNSDYFIQNQASEKEADSTATIRSAQRKKLKLKSILRRHQESQKSKVSKFNLSGGGFLEEGRNSDEESESSPELESSSSEENRKMPVEQRDEIPGDKVVEGVSSDERQRAVCDSSRNFHRSEKLDLLPVLADSEVSRDGEPVLNDAQGAGKLPAHSPNVFDIDVMNVNRLTSKVNKLSRKQQKRKRYDGERTSSDVARVTNDSSATNSSNEERIGGAREKFTASCRMDTSHQTKVEQGLHEASEVSDDSASAGPFHERKVDFDQISCDRFSTRGNHTVTSKCDEDDDVLKPVNIVESACSLRKDQKTSQANSSVLPNRPRHMKSKQSGHLKKPLSDKQKKSDKEKARYEELLSLMISDSDKDENDNSMLSSSPTFSGHCFEDKCNVSQQQTKPRDMPPKHSSKDRNVEDSTNRKRKRLMSAKSRQSKLMKLEKDTVPKVTKDSDTDSSSVVDLTSLAVTKSRLSSSTHQRIRSRLLNSSGSQQCGVSAVDSKDDDSEESCMIIEEKCTERKTSLEMYTQEMDNSLQGIRDLSDLSEEKIKYLVYRNEAYLRGIFQGKIYSWRHEDYKKGGNRRVNLTYLVHMTMFSEEQQEAVIQALTDMFCAKHNKYLDYVLKVMFAEAFIKIYMDIHHTTHEQSEQIMQDYLKQPLSSQQTP